MLTGSDTARLDVVPSFRWHAEIRSRCGTSIVQAFRHHTQLLRVCDEIANMDKVLAASQSRDRHHSDDLFNTTENGDHKEFIHLFVSPRVPQEHGLSGRSVGSIRYAEPPRRREILVEGTEDTKTALMMTVHRSGIMIRDGMKSAIVCRAIHMYVLREDA